MHGRDPVAVLKDIASRKRRFSLTELLPYLDSPLSTDELFVAVSKALRELGLSARREGDDYEIRVETVKKPLSLSRRAKEQIDGFLRSPGIPSGIEDLVEEYITRRTGKPWDDPVVLERIRRAVVIQKDQFWEQGRNRKIGYKRGYSVFAYLAYHFPVYLVQSEQLLYTLAMKGLLPDRVRILDAGTGPGVFSLGAIDFFSRVAGNRIVDLYAVEQADEQLDAYGFLVPKYAATIPGVKIHPPFRADLRGFNWESVPGLVDLIVFQNVFNEMSGLSMDEKAGIVANSASLLDESGTILLVEPADLDNSTALRKLSMYLVQSGFRLLGPCMSSGLPRRCDPSSCWTFDQKPGIRPTRLMKALAGDKERYRFENTDVKYSYAILGKPGEFPVPARVRAPGIRFSNLQRYLNRRIDTTAAVLSGDLGGKGYRVYKICDGTSQKPVYAILPVHQRSASNKALTAGHYGEVLEFRRVLVRYNPRYHAYNLLVTRNSDIRPA